MNRATRWALGLVIACVFAAAPALADACPTGCPISEQDGMGCCPKPTPDPGGGRKKVVKPVAKPVVVEPPVDLGQMITIPGGTFATGCDPVTDEQCPKEYPGITNVTLTAFEIDKSEVTQAAYKACVDAGKCLPPTCQWEPQAKPNHPATCVTWEQAAQFCGWADKRLVKELEWEVAARSTKKQRYPWGNEAGTCEQANRQGCGETAKPVSSHPKGASPYGVQDLAGNVAEWVSDFYLPIPDAGKTLVQVHRGGSYVSPDGQIRVVDRVVADASTKSAAVGFRCARGQQSAIATLIASERPKVEEPAAPPPVVVAPPPTLPTKEPSASSDGRLARGIVIGGAGLVMLGVAGYSFYNSSAKVDDARPHCHDDGLTSCNMTGLDYLSSARDARTLGTVLGIAGIAATGIGAYFTITSLSGTSKNSPKPGVQVRLSERGIHLSVRY